ncbi:hypothetical protein ACLRDC_09870 [Gluconacetobacter sacchari]|uniref:Uncharacterized protein n=2 Tax=Gluconacetobacter sacchari TaxID=92759 RepID=A0A7W4IDA2_9PROT|nr:hypothetical protein [Gluconacetobacter sacchari]MBB2160758.1 hypothetical protein [Gluconacetobacter sacchari]GBQ29182.1 hypothetical protein AA12717_3172 [Gluconacetobacter sacchari DSM 12717]
MTPLRPRATPIVAWMAANFAAALLPPVYLSLGIATLVLPGLPWSIAYFLGLGLSIVGCLLAAYRDDERRGYFTTCSAQDGDRAGRPSDHPV